MSKYPNCSENPVFREKGRRGLLGHVRPLSRQLETRTNEFTLSCYRVQWDYF
jgi:hypothetical protein